MSGVIYRQLPVEEFERLRPLYERYGDPLPVPANTVFYVAEAGGEIVGLIAGQQVVCVTPLWVREDYRGNGLRVAERLAVGGYELLPEGMQKMFITGSEYVERLAHRMGFKPKLGQLWLEEL